MSDISQLIASQEHVLYDILGASLSIKDFGQLVVGELLVDQRYVLFLFGIAFFHVFRQNVLFFSLFIVNAYESVVFVVQREYDVLVEESLALLFCCDFCYFIYVLVLLP